MTTIQSLNFNDIKFLESLESITTKALDTANGLRDHPRKVTVLPSYNQSIYDDWLLCQEYKEEILRKYLAGDAFQMWGCKNGWSWEATAVEIPTGDAYRKLTFHVFPYGSRYLDCGVYRSNGISSRVLILKNDPPVSRAI